MRGRASAGRGESAGDETCPCRGGRVWGEESLLAARGVHAREGERGERESAGGETCPMRGRAGVGRGRLLAMRPVPCGGGRVWGGGVCWW